MEGTFPNKDSIYEYVVDPKNKCWVHWEEKLRSGWKYNPRYDTALYVLVSLSDVRPLCFAVIYLYKNSKFFIYSLQ